jgi:hypothetical protein
MKKMMVLTVLMGLAACVSAQKDPVNAAFEKYAGKEGFTTVNISGDMLNMISQAEEERRDTNFQSKLTDLKILVRDKKCDELQTANFRTEVYDKLDKKEYKEMMTVKESDQDVVILVKESGGRVSELLLLVTGKDNNVMIQAKGDMLLRELADLSGKYPMKGFEQLKNLEKKH